MWRRNRGKEIWAGFVHKKHIKFFKQLGKCLLSKWNVDISISAELPSDAYMTEDIVSILVRKSDVFFVDASVWLDNPDHIGRFFPLSPHFSFESYFIFYTNPAEKERVINLFTKRFFTRPMVIPNIKQANFIVYDPELAEKKFTKLFEQISEKIEDLRRKRVFICHASEDTEFTQKLAWSLEERGLHVWYDEWELRVGDSIVQRINDGIKESRFMVVVLSPSSVEKPWCQREMNSALYSQLSEKQITVLPALIDDCNVPILLSELKWADFRSSFENGLNELTESVLHRSDRY